MQQPPPLSSFFLLSFLSLLVRGEPSYVFGDLSNDAPFELPADLFREYTSHPGVASNVSVPGYNVSDPDSDSNEGVIDGWRLSAAVVSNVPLAKAGNQSIDKSKFTDATILGFSGPGGEAAVDNRWKVCATVYLGGILGNSGNPANGTPSTGSCESVLPSACLKQMMVWGSVSGVDAQGRCRSPGLQPKCEGHIGNDGESAAFALTKKTVSAGRVLAYGSSPIDKNNSTALDEATKAVWPVVVAWGHVNQQGEMQSTNAYVSCVRASDRSTGSTGPDSGPGSGLGSGGGGKNAGVTNVFSAWTLVAALAIAALMAV